MAAVFALWVMIIDVGKGVVAAGVLPHLFLFQAPVDAGWTAALCGAAAVVGHVFPVFFRFRGGKGVATFLGALLVLAPWALIPALLLWTLVLIFTGYVGLSSILAAWSVPVSAGITTGFSAVLVAVEHTGDQLRVPPLGRYEAQVFNQALIAFILGKSTRDRQRKRGLWKPGNRYRHE